MEDHEAEAQELIHEADKNGDGTIDEAEIEDFDHFHFRTHPPDILDVLKTEL